MAPFPPSIQRSGSVLGEDQTTNEAPVASTDEREPDRQGGGEGLWFVTCRANLRPRQPLNLRSFEGR